MNHETTPRDYFEPVVLKDGASLIIRALHPADRFLLADLFRRLSPQSIRYRAFGSKSALSERELTYLVKLDFMAHVALAVVARTGNGEQIVGVGRYCRVEASGEMSASAPGAELAFAVADEHQGRGIGTLLLEHLARIAHANGVLELHAEVMIDNDKMLQVFADSGYVVTRSLEEGAFHVTFPTNATTAFLEVSLTRERNALGASGDHENHLRLE